MTDTETLYWEANRRLAAHYGCSVTDETQRRMTGRSAMDSMNIYCQETGIPDPPEKVLAFRETLMLEVFARGVPTMPGLREILEAFDGRMKLAIATSAPRRFVDVILPGIELGHHFDVVQTGDTVTHGKPHPEIYLKAMAQLGVTPADSIVLEDSSPGARAGKNAGAYVIAVPNPYTRQQDFSFADHVAADLFEAREVIDRLIDISK